MNDPKTASEANDPSTGPSTFGGRTVAYIQDVRQHFAPKAIKYEVSVDDARLLFAARSESFDTNSQLQYEVDAETWSDLDGDAVFSRLNKSKTVAGAQVLYDRLRRPSLCQKQIAAFRKQTELFENKAELAKEMSQLFGQQQASYGWQYLPDLLWGKLPELSVPRWLLWTLPPLLYLSIAATIFISSQFFYSIIAIFLASVICNARIKSQLEASLSSLLNLAFILGFGVHLQRHHRSVPEFEKVRKLIESLPKSVLDIRRHGFWLSFKDPLGIVEYAQSINLSNARRYASCRATIQAHQLQLQELYLAVGTLEVALSVSAIREEFSQLWTRPKFVESTSNRTIYAEGLVHPLIEDAVANNVRLQERGLVITGLNMSGKSSYLRTVGLAALLAQSIDTVFAKSYRAGLLRVLSSMGIHDSLTQKRSHYQSEAQRIQRILDESNKHANLLILLDEIFRGTNSVERIAVASAVLNFLASRQLILAATHDMEVVPLTQSTLEPVHFAEGKGPEDQFYFDYKMKAGICPTKNAIEVLRRMGYPDSIVSEALEVVTATEAQTDQKGNDVHERCL